MDNTCNIACKALEKYFTSLSSFGYKSYDNVDKLLILIMLDIMLNSSMSYYVTEQDYRSIINALYCIMGSDCLFSLPTYTTYDSLIRETIKNVRISEDSILRISESDILRIKS